MTLQAAVIGEGTLLLSCLSDLLESSFKISAVFTDTVNAVSFCDDRNIAIFSSRTNIEESLCSERPDYIFSINNPRILKQEEISVSRCMTMNYHDSILPRYAGSNATCWAIVNGETSHGVSWHVVETGIDTGDILTSEKVTIAADDTVFTLNMKCQEASRRSFNVLLRDIMTGGVHPVPQDLSLRTYYSIYKLLPNMGILDFKTSFETIYNFVRALEYGHHDNMVGVARIKTPLGSYLLVKSAEPVSDLFDTVSPGTVLCVVSPTVVIATDTDPIKLNLAQLDGSPILPKGLEKQGLSPGQSIHSNVAISGDLHLELIRKKEGFWKRKLQSYEPTTFFSQKMNVLANMMDTSGRLDVKKITICEFEPNSDVTYLHAAFLAFLARVCCVSEVNIGFLAKADTVPSDITSLYVNILPCKFQVQLTLEANSAIMKLESDLKRHNLDKPFLRDVFHRYAIPARSPFHNLVLGQGSCTIPEEVFHECNMLLLFETERNELVATYNKIPGQNYGYICNTIKHFSTFLSSLKSSVSLELSDISLISVDEVKQWYTHCEEEKSSEQRTVIKGLEKWCTDTPKRIAMKSTGLSLTYEKCHKYITKLSGLICERKSQETHTIPIHMPNSIQYVLTVLAMLKCGVTFLPIPTDYPPDRVKFILSDSNVREMLIFEELYVGSLLDSIPESTVRFRTKICGKTMVMISWNGIQISDQDIIQEESRKECQASDEACYIIYTSGSTGRPKGVKVKESSVFNMTEAQIAQWDLDASDVIAQFASIGFDASISEIFTSLLSGGTLAIIEKDQKHGHEFAMTISALGVTTVTLPPSVLNIYSPSDLPTVRKLVTAGEPCPLRVALKWSKGTGVRVFNAYGPTETTVCATMYEHDMGSRTGEDKHDLPIGRAIAGCYVYLFDDYMQPVPSGVVGEMYIGGRGLSEGYIGHAQDRNHASFVQNPMSSKTELLYKTGDHALKDEDGVLTFVGRIDNQVKVRGHRIDLSEIEQVLIQHIMVQVAVVVVHRCSHSQQQTLSAFIAPDIVFLSELREYLAKVLPKYMIPTYIKKFRNRDFPMTVNGKVDRDALSRDETIHEQNINVGHSHLNETQLAVARLWCEVLQLDNSQAYSMYRTSSFSELGGNSLHLVLLQRAIMTHFLIHLSFTDIGSSDTIEAFAQVIQKKREPATPGSANTVRRSSSQLTCLVLSDTELDFSGSVGKLFDVDIGLKCSPPLLGRKVAMTILISGVTGFLGAYMLSELLEKTIGNICCMVRGTTEVKGFGRVVENLRKYGLWKFEYSNRIAIVISDLSQKNLGIAPDIYDALTNDVDAVFINGAMMDFNRSYEAHRQANVNSTREFIKFAVKNRRKYLFLTSSLTVFLFPVNTTDTMMMEADSFTDPTPIEGGYGLSKWASEKLVMKALDHLPGGAIFRPARISGNSSDGVGPTNDLFARTLIGMNKMGSYPDLSFPYDLTPVDFCAKAMIEIACTIRSGQSNDRRVFHLFNKNTIPFRDLFKGTTLRALPLTEWRDELRSLPEDNVELLPLTPFFMSRFWDRAQCWPVFDTSNTDSLTSDATKKLLKPTAELLEICKGFYVRSGSSCSCT